LRHDQLQALPDQGLLHCLHLNESPAPFPRICERIAVVTGGGSGIGRAIALGYAREGAQVAVLDVNDEAAAETVKAITGAGAKACSFALDVTERV
jgi:NAD(P)-dependent dehydrogenase (short-subunit alcohol dehydrogenase family)